MHDFPLFRLTGYIWKPPNFKLWYSSLSEIPQNRKTVFPSTLGPLATEKHLHKHKLANLSLMCAMIGMTTSHFTTCLFLFAFMEMSSQVNTVSFACPLETKWN